MADFPSIDVTCRVPGALVNGGDNVVDFAVSSTANELDLLPSSAKNSTGTNNQIDTLGRDLNGLDPKTYETVPVPYKSSDLRLFARALDACNNNVANPNVATTLADLSRRMSTLADERREEADQSEARQRKGSAAGGQKKEEHPAAKTTPTTLKAAHAAHHEGAQEVLVNGQQALRPSPMRKAGDLPIPSSDGTSGISLHGHIR